MKIRTTFVALAALFTATAYAQTLYKIVGPDGKITYSDQQPEGKKAQVLKYAVAPAASGQAQRNKVVLYSASWCGYCTRAKAYMAAANIRYDEIDVDTTYGRNSFALATGAAPLPDNKRVSGIPFLVVGDKKQRGYSPQTYASFFASLREPVRGAREEAVPTF